MDFETTEILATAGAPPNGGARVWLESVSAGMRTVEAVIRELSQNDVPMLVVAERGSGKAAAAARIHALSVRARRSRWNRLSSGSGRPNSGGPKGTGSPDRFEWQWQQR